MSDSAKSRVGVITLPGRYNYGNRLQNFAVTHILSDMGFDVESLELKQRTSLVRSAKGFVKERMGKREIDPGSLMSPGRIDAFARFETHIATRTIERLDASLRFEYERFCVGSDQVWNPLYMRYNEDWYFLKFARPEQRVAFSPSVGLDALDRRQAHRVRNGVKGFPALSVRERRGADLIRKCSGREPLVTVDPTLVLSANDWRSVADARVTPSGDYVLAYLLGGLTKDAVAALETATGRGRMPVVPLSDRCRKGEPPAGPSEFISLIDNAKHVVTDSFHAAVFSMLLATPFTIVRREGTSMFSRIASLAETFQLESHIYPSVGCYRENVDDCAGVDACLAFERAKILSYLAMCFRAEYSVDCMDPTSGKSF